MKLTREQKVSRHRTRVRDHMNMPATIHLSLTQEDIDEGIPCTPGACPVSLSLKRLYPEMRNIIIGYYYSEIDGVMYEHDPHTREFIRDFDAARLCRSRVLPTAPVAITLERRDPS